MDEKIKAIQQRLRAALSEPLKLDEQHIDIPIVAFEEVAMNVGSSRPVIDVVQQELERRGHRVVRLRHSFANTTGDAPSLAAKLDALGRDYDVVLGEGFGYITVPKFLVTDRVQEGFNLGLPNIIGFASGQEFDAMIPRFEPEDAAGIANKIEQDIICPRADKEN
jgi:hypothetical protein